jgi:hypothetical protein
MDKLRLTIENPIFNRQSLWIIERAEIEIATILGYAVAHFFGSLPEIIIRNGTRSGAAEAKIVFGMDKRDAHLFFRIKILQNKWHGGSGFYIHFPSPVQKPLSFLLRD